MVWFFVRNGAAETRDNLGMVAKVSIPTALSKLTAEYRGIVEKAAGNEILTPKERTKLESAWAYKAIPRKNISVDKAMDILEPKLAHALAAISSDHKNITPADADKLFVTELRTKAQQLFGADAKLAKVKGAIAKLDLEGLHDYGKHLSIGFHGPQTLAQLVEDITGNEYNPSAYPDDWSETKGVKAPKDFAAYMRATGAEEKARADEDPETAVLPGPELEKRFGDVAKEVEKAFKASDFKQIRSMSHAIAEDGDTEYALLLAQKKDNSWIAITWSNWPF